MNHLCPITSLADSVYQLHCTTRGTFRCKGNYRHSSWKNRSSDYPFEKGQRQASACRRSLWLLVRIWEVSRVLANVPQRTQVTDDSSLHIACLMHNNITHSKTKKSSQRHSQQTSCAKVSIKLVDGSTPSLYWPHTSLGKHPGRISLLLALFLQSERFSCSEFYDAQARLRNMLILTVWMIQQRRKEDEQEFKELSWSQWGHQ